MIPVTAVTITSRRRCALAAFGLAVCGLVQAQTPEISTVLAMSGSRINDGVVRGPDGALYGASAASSSATGALFFRVTPNGASVRTLYQFDNTDGAGPAGALLLGSDGEFYGTAQFSNGGITEGGGTVFRVAPDGSGFTKLHEFAGSTSTNVNSNPVNTNGVSPNGALIEGSDGFLYGVTRFGGPNGAGVVYKVGRDGSGFRVLHRFAKITSAASSATIVNPDGAHPRAGLVESAGYFYGTTNAGGANGQGTIFRLRFDGSEFSVLHVFTTPVAPSGSTVAVNEDGASPQAGLTDGGDGLLYGTTTVGGANGVGVLYSITPDGSVRTTLHDFRGKGGSQPIGGLLLATDSRLYGTTSSGGATSSGDVSTQGIVYSITRDGTDFTKLADFGSGTGANGNGRMVQLNGTEFIGTTSNGGRCGAGAIFRLSLAGTAIEGDTTCGEDSGGGGGGGATSWLVVLLFAMLLPAIRVPQLAIRRGAGAAGGSSKLSEAHRLSQSVPRSRPPRSM
jgi:uncharacterized repeat protein (TIGR03803 family)